jgi:hypothetical protein
MKQVLVLITLCILCTFHGQAQPKSPIFHYYMTGYTYNEIDEQGRDVSVYGGLGFSTSKPFPSMKEIIKIVRCANEVDKDVKIAITSIYQFKSKTDYDTFFKDEESQTVDLDNPSCN